MGIVELLRRLAQAARSGDERTALSVLGLAQHHGWMREVNAAVRLMPSRDAAFVLELLAPPAEARVAGGGGGYLPTNTEQWRDPFPRSAEQMVIATGGFGVWTSGSGYACEENSGPLVPSFGSTSLAPSSSPLYGLSGLTSRDKAVSFDSDNDCFDGGTSLHNVGATDDLLAIWVGFATSAPVGSVDIFLSKLTTGAGWQIGFDNSSGNFYFQGMDAVPTTLFTALGASPHLLSWHVGGAVVERATGRARLASRSLSTGTSSVVAEQVVAANSMSNAVAFRFGERADSPAVAPTTMKFAGVYVTTGSGVATGCSTNLATILQNFASYLMA
jgi:hypothetical protein